MSKEKVNYTDKSFECSRLIGQPINYTKPNSVELSAIADVEDPAEAGEHVWTYSGTDTDADQILDVAADGEITVVERSPLSDTELTFDDLNSKLERVKVTAVLNSPDTKILGRRKESITRGMDKSEVKLLLDGILNGTLVENGISIPSITTASGSSKDIYDLILEAKHLIEDYGDNYLLLAGNTVNEKFDTYDKDNASSFNYNVRLKQTALKNVDTMKVFGQVDRGSGKVRLLAKKKFILIARNSRVTAGKPVKFVRRRINAQLAEAMGADVNNAQRATITNPVPTIESGKNYLSYGVYGVESFVAAITNPKAICVVDASTIL